MVFLFGSFSFWHVLRHKGSIMLSACSPPQGLDYAFSMFPFYTKTMKREHAKSYEICSTKPIKLSIRKDRQPAASRS